MAITLPNASRSAACNAVVDLVDAGSGAGKLVIMTSGDAVLATITLDDPAFGAASNGVATGAGTPLTAVATGDGAAAKFQVTDSDDTVIWSGTVTATGGGGDVTFNTTSILTGQTVTVSSLSYTQPA